MGEEKILLLEDLYEEGFTSGTKARQDVRAIINGDIFYCYLKKKSKIKDYAYSLVRLFFHLPMIYKRKKILLQYPFYSNEKFNRICYRILPSRAVLLIHDIKSLRYEESESQTQKEIRQINRFEKLIVHNEKMKKWLEEQGIPGEKMTVLQMFDYLTAGNGNIKGSGENGSLPKKEERETAADTLAFAGNLGKSPFIDKMLSTNDSKRLKFALYGIQPSELILKSGFYRGVEAPDRLPDVLEGSYGLVWDGQGLGECEEAAGRYLQYNCPHKYSLYMAAGIPVIIGKHSAMAEITEQGQLGIMIEDLRELPERIAAVSPEDYRQMKENVRRIRERVRKGMYLKDVLRCCGL